MKVLIKQKEINHFNLEIIGKTGVGKSTLINAIFKQQLAEERKGQPCTMETTCYTSNKYDFLRIYDTRGIEISKNFDIEKVFNETLKDIKEKCEKNEPDDLIHCLLYCFKGTRFEKEEGEIVVKLRQTYEGKTLPIILVLTQDIGEDDNEEENGKKDELHESIDKILKEKCNENLSKNAKGITLIKILAKEKKLKGKFIIPAKGLDELLDKCLEKGEYSSKFAILSSIKYSADKQIREDFFKIKNDILIERERFFKKLFEENIEKSFEAIIEKVFIIFSLQKTRELVSDETFNTIKSINEKIIKLILEKEDKTFRNYVEEKAQYIASRLIDK